MSDQEEPIIITILRKFKEPTIKKHYNKKLIAILVVLCIAIPTAYGLGSLWQDSIKGDLYVHGSYELSMVDNNGDPMTTLPTLDIDLASPLVYDRVWVRIFFELAGSGSKVDYDSKTFTVESTPLTPNVPMYWKAGTDSTNRNFGSSVSFAYVWDSVLGKYYVDIYYSVTSKDIIEGYNHLTFTFYLD